MRCRTCQYSLTSLAEHRCPECGTTFDPNDPETFESKPPRGPFATALRCCILVFAVSFGIQLVLIDSVTLKLAVVGALIAAVATVIAYPILLLYCVMFDNRNK